MARHTGPWQPIIWRKLFSGSGSGWHLILISTYVGVHDKCASTGHEL